MRFYIEVTLLPSVDISLYFLWEKVYGQVHLALVEQQDKNRKVAIGVSFPDYDEQKNLLGTKLRLFAGSREELEAQAMEKWLARLLDYVHITSIREVPVGCEYGVFKRLQPKSNNARLARRKAKRAGVSFDEAMASFAKDKEKMSKAPYLWCNSLESKKRYRLLIGRSAMEQAQIGTFSTYGLSSSSTVPIF